MKPLDLHQSLAAKHLDAKATCREDGVYSTVVMYSIQELTFDKIGYELDDHFLANRRSIHVQICRRVKCDCTVEDSPSRLCGAKFLMQESRRHILLDEKPHRPQFECQHSCGFRPDFSLVVHEIKI